jgi:hypothetical protein
MHGSGQMGIADPSVELKPLHDLEVHVIDPVPARHPFPAVLSPARFQLPARQTGHFLAVKAYGWAPAGTRRIFLQNMCFAAHFLRKSGGISGPRALLFGR